MKQIFFSILLFMLSISHAFSVKISIEEINYHTDCKGPVKSVKETESNNSTITYYDEEGRFLHMDDLSGGIPRTVSSMKYNSAGNPVEFHDYQRTINLKYNSEQQLIGFQEQTNAHTIYYSEKQYNPKGLEYRVLTFRSSGDLDVMGEFTYDENNNISEIRSYKCKRKGWEKTGLIKKEYTKNNVLKAEYWYNYGWGNITPKLRCKKFFNEDGKLETELLCNSEGETYETIINTYDERGNMTKMHKKNDNEENVITTTYTYDKYGNPTEIREVFEKNKEVKYSYTKTYEYEYYPTVKKTIVPKKSVGYGPTAKLEQEGKWAQSFKTLTELAAKGNKEAQCRLAFYYYTATATPANYQKAAELYKVAADNGSAEAKYNLGYCYHMGTGVEQSVDEARKWFVKAAENGYKKAYYYAALLLQLQTKGDSISEKGLQYLRKSAATGYQPAKNAMYNFEKYKKEHEEKKKIVKEDKKTVKHKKEDIVIAVDEKTVAITAEAVEDKPVKDDFVYLRVEEKASFTGGMKAYQEYWKNNMVYPEQAKKEGIQGHVILEFTVNKDGSITDITIKRSVSPDLDKEAVRVVKNMPNWKPAKNGGKPVRSKITWPFSFKLEQQ